MPPELSDIQNQQNEEVINQTPSSPDNPVIGQEPAKKVSLRDQLKKNFKEAAEALDGKPAALKPEKTPVKADERPRDETGKFMKAEESAPKESPQTKPEVPPEASETIRPPSSWSAEAKAEFANLSEHVKSAIVKRETEQANGFKSKDETLKRYQEIEQVLGPARPIYQQWGVQSDAEAVKRLFAWEAYLRANPQQAIQEIARQYGINFAPNSPNPQQEDIPQAVRPVLDQFGRLSQEFNAFKTDFQRQQEERIAQELASFAKDKPYFERVRVQMGQLMQAGIATDLAGAYQKAIALSPEIQAEIKSDEEAKKLIEQQKHNQERVQSAAKAAVSPSTRAPSGVLPSTKKQPGIRGSILQAIEEVRGNGRA